MSSTATFSSRGSRLYGHNPIARSHLHTHIQRTSSCQGYSVASANLRFQKVPVPEIQLIVADNDAGGTAADVCGSIPKRWPVKYVIEPRRGISHTRNRAIGEATAVEHSVHDDDEIPEPAWLDELLWTQGQTGADVVAGPVLPSSPRMSPKG